MRYILEIYDMDDLKTALMILESDSPFMGFETGDLISTASFTELNLPSDKVFRVFAVEHHIWKSNDVKHKKCIYAKLIDDKKSLRNPNRDD